MAKFFVLLWVAFGFFEPAFGQESPWQGLYLQGQTGFAVGEHSLFYEHEKFDLQADIYSIPLEGTAQAVGIGYRHELGDSDFYVGARVMAHFGELRGSKEWSALGGVVGARVDFTSTTIYTVGVEVGYAFNRWLVYGGGGIAGAELSIEASAHALGHTIAEKAEGWTAGSYLALGVQRDIGKGWAIGAEAQHFYFEGEESVRGFGHDLGSFKATVEDTRIALTLTKTF